MKKLVCAAAAVIAVSIPAFAMADSQTGVATFMLHQNQHCSIDSVPTIDFGAHDFTNYGPGAKLANGTVLCNAPGATFELDMSAANGTMTNTNGNGDSIGFAASLQYFGADTAVVYSKSGSSAYNSSAPQATSGSGLTTTFQVIGDPGTISGTHSYGDYRGTLTLSLVVPPDPS